MRKWSKCARCTRVRCLGRVTKVEERRLERRLPCWGWPLQRWMQDALRARTKVGWQQISADCRIGDVLIATMQEGRRQPAHPRGGGRAAAVCQRLVRAGAPVRRTVAPAGGRGAAPNVRRRAGNGPNGRVQRGKRGRERARGRPRRQRRAQQLQIQRRDAGGRGIATGAGRGGRWGRTRGRGLLARPTVAEPALGAFLVC